MKLKRVCVLVIGIFGSALASSGAAERSVNITAIPGGTSEVAAIGNWHKLSDANGWTFRPANTTYHLEVALYDSAEALLPGQTPFAQFLVRTSGEWPDGPENDLGELGDEVSPNVLGDKNTNLFGKPHYRSLRLYEGVLSADSVYQISFSGSIPPHIWIHPLHSSYFTMLTDVLQSSESTLQSAAWGPASVSRTIVDPVTTRFEYTGLLPGSGTGLKDDYAVQEYGQRPGSHGSGDFGWFPGYSQHFHNEGPGAVFVSLFVNTGFTGPSGAPGNNPANDTFWKSSEVFLNPGDSAVAALDFEGVTGWGVPDNPFPHTAGDQTVPDGTSGIAVNVFDRLQVSATGWEVRSGTGGAANANLVVTPLELAPYGPVVGSFMSPTAGESWDVGSDQSIEWIPGTSTTSRAIQISRDGGAWDDVATGIPNTGEYLWSVTGPVTDNTVLRIFPSGNEACAQLSEVLLIVDPATSISDDSYRFAGRARFDQIVPNPFNSSTELRYVLPGRSFVRITIYDVKGRRVRRLLAMTQGAGYHVARWDGADERGTGVSSGAYFARVETQHGSATRRLTLIK